MNAPIVIFWAMKSYSVVRCCETFGGMYCLHLQDGIIFGVGNLKAKYSIFWNLVLCEIALPASSDSFSSLLRDSSAFGTYRHDWGVSNSYPETDHEVQVVTVMKSGGARFESRPGHRPSWRSFLGFLSPYRQMQGWYYCIFCATFFRFMGCFAASVSVTVII